MPHADLLERQQYMRQYRANHRVSERERSARRRAERTPEEWAAFYAYKRAWRAARRGPVPTREERFWAKVAKGDGCWTWTGANNGNGYGVQGRRVTRLAHRFAWELRFGAIPDGLWVLHHCDNPACVKTDPDEQYPDGHLFLGTPLDNQRDMQAKGRARYGGHTKGDVKP